jgi:arginyl-tRNA synthetase
MTLCDRPVAELARASTIKLTHGSERPLALHIVRFPEVLEIAISELAPHRLTEYLYELSEVYNSFYRDCKVCDNCVPCPVVLAAWMQRLLLVTTSCRPLAMCLCSVCLLLKCSIMIKR